MYLQQAAALPTQVHELAVAPAPPDVTVVVPTYNHRHYVLDLFRCLEQQTHPNFEVVIVDDGSTDGTFEALQAAATGTPLHGRLVRLLRNAGRSPARNTGVLHATAPIIAFTDADCLPHPGWLAEGLQAMAHDGVDVLQGKVAPAPGQRQPFFNHFIDIASFDGTYSTCNVLYRKQTLLDAGGFNPALNWGEDVDLGYRVLRQGAKSGFSADALVYHQVLPLTPLRWLKWPLWFRFMPLRTAVYPEYRRFLFLGIWTNWFHAVLDLAILSGVLAATVHPAWLLLSLPYAVAFFQRRGLAGRWGIAKAFFHVLWDLLTVGSLLVGTVRHRSLVL